LPRITHAGVLEFLFRAPEFLFHAPVFNSHALLQMSQATIMFFVVTAATVA